MADVVFATVNWTMAPGSQVEQLRASYAGSTLGLTLTANEFANLVAGWAAADVLFGEAGDDTMNGGAGADAMTGGFGTDTYVVDNAGDVVIESQNGGAADVVYAGVNWTLTAGSKVEQVRANYAGTGQGLTIAGNELNNLVVGGTGVDTLLGEAGNDTLNGRAGGDEMVGGSGSDTYVIDNAGDIVTEGQDGGADVVYATASWTVTAGSAVEQLRANYGAATTDLALTGNGLSNLVAGGGAADTLSGGAGNDTLTGGAGSDAYVFVAGFGSDVITDFDANPADGGQDLIDLSAYDFTAASIGTDISIAAVGGGTSITIGAGTVVLTGVDRATVDESDFIF